jgi:hypothetical protein
MILNVEDVQLVHCLCTDPNFAHTPHLVEAFETTLESIVANDDYYEFIRKLRDNTNTNQAEEADGRQTIIDTEVCQLFMAPAARLELFCTLPNLPLRTYVRMVYRVKVQDGRIFYVHCQFMLRCYTN